MTLLPSTQYSQIIKAAVTRRPAAVPSTSIMLWQKMAVELVSIIGEGGFQSLYARSVSLTGATYPWMMLDRPSQPDGTRFAGLQATLEQAEPAEASAASILLLVTFIDILAVLIGEYLTTSILQSAWGDDAMNIDVKELQ